MHQQENMVLTDNYHYSVKWSIDDQAYVARVAEFPSLAADGESEGEAVVALKEVVASCIRDMKKHGDKIPVPTGA